MFGRGLVAACPTFSRGQATGSPPLDALPVGFAARQSNPRTRSIKKPFAFREKHVYTLNCFCSRMNCNGAAARLDLPIWNLAKNPIAVLAVS